MKRPDIRNYTHGKDSRSLLEGDIEASRETEIYGGHSIQISLENVEELPD